MPYRELGRQEWKAFFDTASRRLPPTQVDVEIAGEEIGDQEAMRARGLTGLAYDPRDDEFEVVAESLDHLISHPKSIYVNVNDEALSAVTIEDADGNRQFIRLAPPITLH